MLPLKHTNGSFPWSPPLPWAGEENWRPKGQRSQVEIKVEIRKFAENSNEARKQRVTATVEKVQKGMIHKIIPLP